MPTPAAPNIVASYPPGKSRTAVAPGTAAAVRPDQSARTQLDALLSGEKKTGYRSQPPMMPTPQPLGPRSIASNTTPANNDYDLAGRRAADRAYMDSREQPPQKYITFPQPTGYGIYISRELNPEYEMWYENKFGKPYGEGNVEFVDTPAPLYGESNYDMVPFGVHSFGFEGEQQAIANQQGGGAVGSNRDMNGGSGGSGGGSGGGQPDWYDMPEWQRTQILAAQLWNEGSGQTEQEQRQNKTGSYYQGGR